MKILAWVLSVSGSAIAAHFGGPPAVLGVFMTQLAMIIFIDAQGYRKPNK